jgi:hypothetical protein
MNSHQIARANSEWLGNSSFDKAARFGLYAGLACVFLLFGLGCIV